MTRWLVGILLLAALGVGGRLAWELRPEPLTESAAGAGPAGVEVVSRGEYLARAGSCMGCHSARGGAPYAGGRPLETPFGTVHAPNLTPDATGLGGWTAAEFWRALHHGRSHDGSLLYPVFPYTHYTRVTRGDSDALFAFLQSLPKVRQPNRPHELRFPYDSQLALAAWRVLYFRPGEQQPARAQSAEWNRGAYLVDGLGHCSACHASRNALGATTAGAGLGGGLIPQQNWYAPSLEASHEAGVADWTPDEIVQLLKTGVSARGAVLGPMAEVVQRSTQYLADADLRAMAVYLKALPQSAAAPPAPPQRTTADADAAAAGNERGARLYGQHCAACHGDDGQGAPGAYPALAGSRTVLLDQPVNLVRVVLAGGFAPATAGNPRPYGMPPFATVLGDADIAAVASYVRSAWGHRASAVGALDVNRLRGTAER